MQYKNPEQRGNTDSSRIFLGQNTVLGFWDKYVYESEKMICFNWNLLENLAEQSKFWAKLWAI